MSQPDAAELLFGSDESAISSYRPQLEDSIQRIGDVTGATSEQRTTLMNETALMFRDAQVPPGEAAQLAAVIARHVREPADAATEQKWATDAREQLRGRYGNAEADRRLARAKEFVDARPALKKLLFDTGAGSHPDVVLALAANARDLRIKPK